MKKPASEESAFRQKSSLVGEKDIFSALAEKKGSTLFLGKYSFEEVITVLRKRNFLNDARKRKLWPLVYELDSSEFPLQRLMIFLKEKSPKNLIVDLKIKEGLFRLKKRLTEDTPPEYKFLMLDWLTLQNPLQSFSKEKQPLPGQNFPGLGLGKKVLDVFIYLAKITKNDGILACPAYFHNALLFSRYFNFLNPDKEAEVLAIKKSFSDLSFKQLAWIVHLDCLKDKENRIYEWKAEEQVYPLAGVLRDYFTSKMYKKRVKEGLRKFQFLIDRECFQRKIKAQRSEAKPVKESEQY